MVKPWIGGRRIAFVPVSNQQVDSVVPPDFEDQVESRAFFDPDPATGVDRSLQQYIQTVSSGRAHLDGRVFPAVIASGTDTTGAGMDSLPANHDYDTAVIVLPHDSGPHRGGWAWWNEPERNGITHFARVALYSDASFSSRQNIGVWAMEVLHIATEFGDLYNVSPQLGKYDVMACNCGTHPSAHTKSAMAWLHSGAVRTHPIGSKKNYTLHAVSYPQPAPPGRATAVSIKSRTTSGHFMVEARLRTDDYESAGALSDGIPSEGVLVYEVQGTTEVYQRAVLDVGDSFDDTKEKLTVRVSGDVPGGFQVAVTSAGTNRCAQLQAQIEGLQALLEFETDMSRRKQHISALQQALTEFRALNCLIVADTAVADFAALFASPADDDKSLDSQLPYLGTGNGRR